MAALPRRVVKKQKKKEKEKMYGEKSVFSLQFLYEMSRRDTLERVDLLSEALAGFKPIESDVLS